MQFNEAEWATLATRLDEGLELPEHRREEWLDSLTDLDGRLKSVLRDLLRKHAEGDAGLPETLPKFKRAAERRGELPATIGRYRIVGLVGEGGMGVVYEAEQEQPRRRVALKVVKPGLTSPEVLRRFEQESRSLARLQHPGIAQI